VERKTLAQQHPLSTAAIAVLDGHFLRLYFLDRVLFLLIDCLDVE
jgi:hypothetical protein